MFGKFIIYFCVFTQGNINFFLKYDLKWTFLDILIHFQCSNLRFVELFLYSGNVRLYWFWEIIISLSYHLSKFDCMKCLYLILPIWIKYITRHFKRKNWVGFEPTANTPSLYQHSRQKPKNIFVCILVQTKSSLKPFWLLLTFRE